MHARLDATWAKLQAKAAGSGAACDAARFVDGGDGTVTDNLSGLRWEKKTTDASVHDVGNQYTWTAGAFGATAADGTVFTSFLSSLNGACFAGDCDWRLPTHAELLAILTADFPACQSSPCIDAAFGPTNTTLTDFYWTSTRHGAVNTYARIVHFGNGVSTANAKNEMETARAVRGGL